MRQPERTSKEVELIECARTLAEASLKGSAASADSTGRFPDDAYSAAAASGLVGIAIPRAYGGEGISVSAQAAVIEALANGCAAVVGAVIGNGIQAALSILHGASEELRRSVLPALLQGKRHVAFAITEQTAGSDAAALTCSASRVDEGWKLDGEKVMINRSSLSDAAIVFATVNPELRHRGITAFLVDLRQAGVSVGPLMNKMGQRGLPTGSISFDGAFAPDTYRLGDVGGGFALMMKVVNRARTMVAANAVGRMSAAFRFAVSHSRSRKQFGAPLANLDMVRAEIADMAVAVESARSLVRVAADAVDAGSADEALYAAMAKLHATDACIEVCRRAMLLCGGMGYSDLYPVERMLRDAMAGQIVDGANPIQKQIIAKEILKNVKAF